MRGVTKTISADLLTSQPDKPSSDPDRPHAWRCIWIDVVPSLPASPVEYPCVAMPRRVFFKGRIRGTNSRDVLRAQSDLPPSSG